MPSPLVDVLHGVDLSVYWWLGLFLFLSLAVEFNGVVLFLLDYLFLLDEFTVFVHLLIPFVVVAIEILSLSVFFVVSEGASVFGTILLEQYSLAVLHVV